MLDSLGENTLGGRVSFLERRVEHHLQIMFDHQTHVLPESDGEQENWPSDLVLKETRKGLRCRDSRECLPSEQS